MRTSTHSRPLVGGASPFSAALVLWVLLGQTAAGAPPALQGRGGDTAPGFEAVRTNEPIRTDGQLSEADWQRAPVFSAFHQSFPEPGAPPGERTEVRVLYDDAHLYVGIRCFDREAHRLNAQLGRRDAIPASDVVHVMIDSLRDQRTGHRFSINAGGTLADARLFQDTQEAINWNGIWEGAASRDEQGWSAELRIPFEVLYFQRAEEQVWGFHVQRELARTHEQLDSVPLPAEVNARVSRFTTLRALRGLAPRQHLMLTPMVTLRASRPSGLQEGGPRLLQPSVDLGLDARAGLTSALTLALTLNPVFDEVEPDEFIINLTAVEPFLQEKRPFFLEGLELFEPLTVSSGLAEQSLFYSRRIGLDLPLLGAAKLSGSLSERVKVGVVSTVEAGATDPSRREAFERGEDPEAALPDPTWRLNPARPLHFAPSYTLPAQVRPPMWRLAGVSRMQLSEPMVVGATAALAIPLSSRCQLGLPMPEDEGCTPRGGRAVAAETELRSGSGDYTLTAQVTGSQVTGGPEGGERLSDGTLLQSGDTGLGVQLSGGKFGGEPWRADVSYGFASPRLQLNPTGFQPLWNEQELVVGAEYVHTGWAALPLATLRLEGAPHWSTDGRLLPLGTQLGLSADVEFQNSTLAGCNTQVELGRRDLRELWRSGVALERPDIGVLDCSVLTDPSRALSLLVGGSVSRLLGESVGRRRTGQGLRLQVTWRPQPRLATSIGATYENSVEGPFWVDTPDEGLYLLGDLTPRFLTLTLRQSVVLSPRLTVQAFAQGQSGYERFERFYEAQAQEGDVLLLDALLPTELPPEEDPSYQETRLNVSLVLRWEYALGSTLFVVYSRYQESRPSPEGEPPRLTLLPRGFLGGPHNDLLLLKMGYTW